LKFGHGLQCASAVERIALGGDKAGICDDALQLALVRAAPYTRRKDHIFLDQNAANIVGPELQANLANLDPRRQPA